MISDTSKFSAFSSFGSDEVLNADCSGQTEMLNLHIAGEVLSSKSAIVNGGSLRDAQSGDMKSPLMPRLLNRCLPSRNKQNDGVDIVADCPLTFKTSSASSSSHDSHLSITSTASSSCSHQSFVAVRCFSDDDKSPLLEQSSPALQKCSPSTARAPSSPHSQRRSPVTEDGSSLLRHCPCIAEDSFSPPTVVKTRSSVSSCPADIAENSHAVIFTADDCSPVIEVSSFPEGHPSPLQARNCPPLLDDSSSLLAFGGPRSPGGLSLGSAGGRSGSTGGGGAFFFSPSRKNPHRKQTSAEQHRVIGPARFFRKVPGGVRNYFLRKKKSWPTFSTVHTLHSAGGSQDEAGNEQLMLLSVNNKANNSHSGGGGPSLSNGSVVGQGGAQVERIRNLTSHNSSLQLNTAKRSLARQPSKEDPGPSRESLMVDVADPLDFPLYNTSSMNNNASANSNAKNFACLSNSLLFSYNLPPNGAKFKFLHEGQIQLCRLNHSRTVLGKLSSSKLLRRWENHFLTLGDDEISSKTPNGAMDFPVKYALMEDVHVLPQWDSSFDKFCIRIFVPEGSLLLQRNLYRYRRIIELSSGRPEVLLKETKCLVEQVKCCPLQGDNLSLKAIVLISRLIEQIFAGNLPKTMLDPIIMCVAPLLDTVCTVTEISHWLSKYCKDFPRSRLIDEVLSEVAQQTLKKTMDFGKYQSARLFVQDYLLAVSSQNNGRDRIRSFINSVHSSSSCCPHPRVLPNLVVVSLAAIHAQFDPSVDVDEIEKTANLRCFCIVFEVLSEFEDWRSPLSVLLQPIPFPDDVISSATFSTGFSQLLRRMGADPRCDIHLSLLGVRESKDGWFHLVCPGGPVCCDDGELFSGMLKTLLHCCCRRKKFLQSLNDMLGPLQLLALRENEPSMEALCHMLEFEVVEGEDLKLQMIMALQSTSKGKLHYAALCDRQIALRELQQKGGPRKLTLPSKSTDSDLAVLLSSGSFGNLEWLSLAFTNVTSACADYLIKLPSLRYLNLWSTQFGDSGLLLLSEHLPKLQVLNLCETPMTDKGLLSLSSLKSLRKLNLNSTQLSAKTFLILKTELPALQEVDVRYTDAWCADDIIA